jgi:putative ABC transport system substrate-binding protein
VIVSNGPPIKTVKAATSTIPIVFAVGFDPLAFGLVSSLSRPGGNLTGVSILDVEIGPKRLELLRELIPTATVVALLVNPTTPAAEAIARDVQAAARVLGLQLHVLHAANDRDFDAVFATLAQLRADALIIGGDPFFTSRSRQLGELTLARRVPAIYEFHEFAAAGGLISYGTSLADAYRQVGTYTGRILKGEKPSDLPVQQATKVELILNLKTAKAFDIAVPNSLLGRADEIIE